MRTIQNSLLLLAFALACLFCACAPAEQNAKVIDTQIFSASMQRDIPFLIALPGEAKQAKNKHYPTLYLLHGFGDTPAVWNQQMALQAFADSYQMIIVAANGEKSWYFDSPVDSAIRFTTHIVNELIPYVDSHFPTLARREKRAIAGLSMGGHGALYLAALHPELFGSCGSFSGGVELTPFDGHWELNRVLGPVDDPRQYWVTYSVMDTLPRVDTAPDIYIDVGTEDFFLNANRKLHNVLIDKKIKHIYTERPGQHNWPCFSEQYRCYIRHVHDYFSE